MCHKTYEKYLTVSRRTIDSCVLLNKYHFSHPHQCGIDVFIELRASGQLGASASSYLPFRNIEGEEARKNCFVFYDKMLECTAGKKKWTRKAKVLGTVTASQDITPSDEAFTILCLENYWDKWMAGRKTAMRGSENTENGQDATNKTLTKWTDSRCGHYQFGGWNDAGLVRYNDLYQECKASREEANARVAELAFLDHAIGLYGLDGEKGNVGGRNPVNRGFIAVFDDFEDDEEVDKHVEAMKVTSMGK